MNKPICKNLQNIVWCKCYWNGYFWLIAWKKNSWNFRKQPLKDIVTEISDGNGMFFFSPVWKKTCFGSKTTQNLKILKMVLSIKSYITWGKIQLTASTRLPALPWARDMESLRVTGGTVRDTGRCVLCTLPLWLPLLSLYHELQFTDGMLLLSFS